MSGRALRAARRTGYDIPYNWSGTAGLRDPDQ